MSRRTIQEAREMYEEALPGLSDFRANEIKQAIAANEQAASQRASEYIQSRTEDLSAQRKEALQSLTEARDGYDSLASQSKQGRISSAEYAEQLDAFTSQQMQAEDALKALSEAAEELLEIEEDPVAWADSQGTRIPHLLPEWDF